MLCNRFETRSKNKNLRSQTDFIRSNASTSLYGQILLFSFASKLWQMIQLEIRNSVSTESYKKKKKKARTKQ